MRFRTCKSSFVNMTKGMLQTFLSTKWIFLRACTCLFFVLNEWTTSSKSTQNGVYMDLKRAVSTCTLASANVLGWLPPLLSSTLCSSRITCHVPLMMWTFVWAVLLHELHQVACFDELFDFISQGWTIFRSMIEVSMIKIMFVLIGIGCGRLLPWSGK